ncbi:flagellar basal body rod protein FlgB [Polystyrenella longa]|uniref:Flagellar basal body rod protein FlgB n=1 Tax=Polystyrenella longa TaxID=2528007 RepID=A0A518CIR3_9PLAN|nr:flagellar basal body rod protein FlgB [Polystyrenella longa]QDU79110.1 flagellar basal body rod protein FlgB [Polystyrenella longa]
MMHSLFDQTTIPLLEKVAQFGQRRHEVLAGNLANVDTPDYRPRDLPVDDFKQALQQAVTQRQLNETGGNSAADYYAIRTSPQTKFTEELFQAVEADPENVTFHDNNNRSVETEVAKMTKNMMMQNYAVQLMTAQFNLMQSVISGRA